jgi:hypothetical protein
MALNIRLLALNSIRNNIIEPNLTAIALPTIRRTYYSYANEPTHPIPNKLPKWVNTAEEAVAVVKSGLYYTFLIIIYLFSKIYLILLFLKHLLNI